MPKIDLDVSKCVTYSSKLSKCTLCEDICPESAIEIEQSRVNFVYSNCIECGGCVGVCPSEALSLEKFNTTEFFLNFLKKRESEVISCKKNLPCISVLNVEHLIALAIEREFILDIGHCRNCKESLFQKIERDITEANLTLKTLKSDKEVVAKELNYSKESESDLEQNSRRDFFKKFSLKGAIESKSKFEDELKAQSSDKFELGIDSADIAKKRERQIPNKRKILYTSLKSLKVPQEFEYIQSLSFLSKKSIDLSCNNCSICYRICPSEALSSNSKNSKILFDSMLCLRCKLCEDVCDLNSIESIPIYTKEFFEQNLELLAQFRARKCNECGNSFTYTSGEVICPRCKIEEEEAIALSKGRVKRKV